MTAIAVSLITVLVVSLVVVLADVGERRQQAEASIGHAGTAELTVALVDALHEERLRAMVVSVRDTAPDRRAYRAAAVATDAAARRLEQAWSAARPVAADPSVATGFDDVLAAARALGEVRGPVLDGTVEQPSEVYRSLAAASRDAVADRAFAGDDVQLRLRRATTALLTAAEAAVDRRDLGIEVLTGRTDHDEADLRAGQLAATFADAVGRAGLAAEEDGVEEEVRAAVEDLRSVVAAERSGDVAAALAVPDVAGLGLDQWVAGATPPVDASLAAATVSSRAGAAAARARLEAARRQQLRFSLAFGFALALALVGGVAAAVTARDRALALDEHRTIVDGMLSWFDFAPGAVDGVEVETRLVAAGQFAGAGGDFFDVFPDPAGGVVALIGDVAGHDARAVARMAEVRNKLRGLAHELAGDPAEVIRSLDAALEEGPMTTLLLLRLPREGGLAVHSRAGHLPALLRRRDGHVAFLDGAADLPLGVAPETERQQSSVAVGEGDLLVLYTDGLVDGQGIDLEEALAGLAATVAAPWSGDLAEMADRLVAGRSTATDDVAVMLLRRSADPPPGVRRPRGAG